MTRGRLPGEPPTREELAAAMAANAAAKPLNIAVLLVAFVAGLAVGAPLPLALLVALVLYAAAAARTMFDGDEAQRVAEARREQRPAVGTEEPTDDEPAAR